MTASTLTRPFKLCPMCRLVWSTREDFLKDSDLRYIGHQIGAETGDPGLRMFNHSCGTTLAIEAKRIRLVRGTGWPNGGAERAKDGGGGAVPSEATPVVVPATTK
jgi:hypothetical protein